VYIAGRAGHSPATVGAAKDCTTVKVCVTFTL
jgi:hypothetical protein